MTDFGSLFSPHLIEEGALSTLQRWLPTYMAEVQRQHGVALPEIESWGLSDQSPIRTPDQGLPALVLVAEGTQRGGAPEEYGGGWYRAGWSLTVMIAIQNPEMVEARRTAQVYGAAIRGCLLQRRALGDGLRVTDWTGEENPFETLEKRTRAASENFFLVEQDEVVNWQLGPKDSEPPDEPAETPVVKEVDVESEIKP